MPDAVIIAFPKLRASPAHPPRDYAAAPPQSSPSQPTTLADDHLARAMAGLQAALAEQARAVAEWRFAMAELGIGIAALSHSMAAYDGGLAQLDANVAGLRRQAVSLEAIADRAR